MSVCLTDPAIKKALRESTQTGKRRDLVDASHEGLRIRVTPSGSASWVLACRIAQAGCAVFRSVDTQPWALRRRVKGARSLHYQVRHNGADPIAERRRERERAEAARQGVGTLAALLDVYEKQKGESQRSWPEYRRSITRVFGKFLARGLTELTLADLQLAADGYAAKQQAALGKCRCSLPYS